MISVTKYICEVCHRHYSRTEEALRCELSHNIPKEVDSFRYKDFTRYPDKVYIKMSDGEIIEYAMC